MTSTSSFNSQQTGLPQDARSLFLEDSCPGGSNIMDPTNPLQTFLSSVTGSVIETLTQTVDESTGEVSAVPTYSLVQDERLYKDIPVEDYHIANGLEEICQAHGISGSESLPAQKQLRKSRQESKDATKAIDDWQAFRERCKALEVEVRDLKLVPALEEWIIELLHNWLEVGAALSVARKLAADDIKPTVVEMLNKQGDDDGEKQRNFWLGTFSPEAKAALCGWPIGGVPHQLSPVQGKLFGEMAKVDIETSGFFKIKIEETA